MYLGAGFEAPSQNVSRELVRVCRGEGCTIGAYWWGYASYDPAECVRRANDLAQELVPETNLLWVDHERYPPTGNPWSIPGEAWLRAAGEECASSGIRAGLYGSRYMWGLAGYPMVADLFVYWNANYNLAPDNLNGEGAYGFAEAICHQYTSVPVDRSLIRSDFT
jgi:hypothetical protein